jgi:hypothetical protein
MLTLPAHAIDNEGELIYELVQRGQASRKTHSICLFWRFFYIILPLDICHATHIHFLRKIDNYSKKKLFGKI